MLKLLIICILINIVKCHEYFSEHEALHSKLHETTLFFEKLKTDYVLQTPGQDILSEIDHMVSAHIFNATRAVSTRRKRDAPVFDLSEKELEVLQGFENRYIFKWRNVRDINFFTLPNEKELIAFAVILNTSNIFLARLNNETLDQIDLYSEGNSTRIIVDSCIAGSLLIIQRETGEIVVSRLIRQEDNYIPYTVQDFEPSGVTNLATWHGMNQLYLGMSTSSRIGIFTWLGEHFDLVQDLNMGAQKLHPFYSKGFMHLAAIGSKTTILRYSPRANKFIAIQTLPGSRDVSSFHVKDGHFVEYFLSLSTESSVVLYKELHDRYVPFQQIPFSSSAVFLVMKKSALLLTLENEMVISYQYDGWKFVRLNAKIRNVRQMRRVQLFQEESLLIEHTNNTWKLVKPIWSPKKLWDSLQDDIKTWCIRTKVQVQSQQKEIPKLKGPLRIINGHIGALSAYHLNGQNGINLTEMSKNLEELESKLETQSLAMIRNKNYTSVNFMDVKKVRVRCESKCTVAELNVDSGEEPYHKLKELQRESNKYVDGLRREQIENLNCPRIAIPTENLHVNKLLNGVFLKDLKNNLLKLTGDQEITGEYTFANLTATRIRMPVNIAASETSQELRAREIRVKELSINDGGLLMPLNGSQTVISGSITASKVTVNNPISLNGGLRGPGAQRIDPFLMISESMNLTGEYTLRNVTIQNLLNTTDIVSTEGKSVGGILQNLISLNDNISASLVLSNEKTKWKNVTLRNHPNWITANSDKKIIIRGQKRVFSNVTVTEEVYNRISFPKINGEICAAGVIAPEIRHSVLTIDNIVVNELTSTHIYGKIRNKNVTFGPPLRCFENKKITVKNLTISSFDVNELQTFAQAWNPPKTYNGSIEGKYVTVNHLRFPVKLSPVFLPARIRNMVSRKNIIVQRLNDIDLEEFLRNAVSVEESLFLGNVTFVKGFLSNHTYARNFIRNSTSPETNFHLGAKQVLGNLHASSAELLLKYKSQSGQGGSNITIKGNARFSIEPIIQNVDGRSLKDLLKEIWTTEDDCIFSGKNLQIMNTSLEGNITLNNFLNMERYGSWKNLVGRVLSKTKSQVIAAKTSIDEVEAPSVVSSATSRIRCANPSWTDMLNNTLMKDGESTVKATWGFDKLNVSGNLLIGRKINNLNLKRDVMRRDVKMNIITGKKTVMDLVTENLHGLNFKKWSETALTQRKRKLAVIKGQKNFNSITVNNLHVSGTIMGREMDQVLLKFGDQTILKEKTIDGSLNTSGIMIDDQINDVNLTHLMQYQLKLVKSEQTIETPMELFQDLYILGNLTVDALLSDNPRNGSYGRMASMSKEMEKLWQAAEAIDIALQNRAAYINKLEVVEVPIDFDEENITEIDSNVDRECEVKNLTVICGGETLIDVSFPEKQEYDFILIKIILLNDLFFTVAVQRDTVSLYTTDNTKTGFSRVSELHVPNIIGAYVEPQENSIWIALQLPLQTLVLRYKETDHFQEYILPESKVFSMGRAPNEQLLLLLSDGVWNLEGLGAPRNILDIKFFGEIETFAWEGDYYIRNTMNNNSTLFKFRYIGN